MGSPLTAPRLAQDRRTEGASIASPPRMRPFESSTRSVRLVAAFVRSSVLGTTRSHDRWVTTALPCASSSPTWAARTVRSFLLNTTGSRPSYLRHAPTLLRLKHLVDVPGTEASPPEATELPRLADVVGMEVRSLTGVHLPRGAHTVRTGLSPGRSHRGLERPRFPEVEPTSPSVSVCAAVRGSAPSLLSLTGKPSRASHG